MRGATARKGWHMGLVKSFNPRAHAGRDAKKGWHIGLVKSFNPRAHAGRDNG